MSACRTSPAACRPATTTPTWTLTSYLVANGIVLPIAGWLGRLLGRKRYFLICIAMFTVCSFLCGIATSLPQLVVFRLLQGLVRRRAAAEPAIDRSSTRSSRRSAAAAFRVVAIAVIFAPIIGPTLGGWITDSYSWRWVFLINVPVGVFAFLAVAQLVEDPPWVQRDRARLSDIDYVGLALIALGLGCVADHAGPRRGQRLVRLARRSGCSRCSPRWASSAAIGWLLLVEKPVVDLRALDGPQLRRRRR